ncbi:hypothetical protein Btru_074487 [Bulinus truncatus]|nr:hypothetical protein Btru_074487 [Bulinus truncatus]
MSDILMKSLESLLMIPLNIFTSSFGIFTNIVNMIIVCQLGLGNSMNVEILALSVTDCYITVMELLMFVCLTLDYFIPESTIDLIGLGTITLAWLQYPGLFISNWITTLISLEGDTHG